MDQPQAGAAIPGDQSAYGSSKSRPASLNVGIWNCIAEMSGWRGDAASLLAAYPRAVIGKGPLVAACRFEVSRSIVAR